MLCSRTGRLGGHRLASLVKTKKASFATVQESKPLLGEEELHSNDFILSVLKSTSTARDAKSYLTSFGPRQKPVALAAPAVLPQIIEPVPTATTKPSEAQDLAVPKPSPVVASILNPIHRRTALVKMQGPFTDVQLESITRGLVYLEKLGLTSVIVIENENIPRGEEGDRKAVVEDTMRVVMALEKHGAKARPVLDLVVRLGPKPGDEVNHPSGVEPPEAHTFPSDLTSIRSSLRSGEIPVLPPFALDTFCRSVRVDSNDVIAALARGMVEATEVDAQAPSTSSLDSDVDLTPLRLMIINREGGVPSYARAGLPHLLINLESEYSYIHSTFQSPWKASHPSSLSNLSLARTCLSYMPPTSSAIMVSHRSPSSLIGHLITNKPAVSSSLPHALLQGNRSLSQETPTLLRRGMPITVIKNVDEIDRTKLKKLLQQSFKRELDEAAFYARLEQCLDFVIIAGDYVGAAIVTNEPSATGPISYLDKFAVLPENQGDGTVDFLWVALHDESYGLGHPFSANPNGGKEGKGEGRDLVWRSRSDNPVNKWYFERSTGHIRLGKWVLFWCDAEKRLKIEEGRRGAEGLKWVEGWEEGRLGVWSESINKIPSSWR